MFCWIFLTEKHSERVFFPLRRVEDSLPQGEDLNILDMDRTRLLEDQHMQVLLQPVVCVGHACEADLRTVQTLKSSVMFAFLQTALTSSSSIPRAQWFILSRTELPRRSCGVWGSFYHTRRRGVRLGFLWEVLISLIHTVSAPLPSSSMSPTLHSRPAPNPSHLRRFHQNPFWSVCDLSRNHFSRSLARCRNASLSLHNILFILVNSRILQPSKSNHSVNVCQKQAPLCAEGIPRNPSLRLGDLTDFFWDQNLKEAHPEFLKTFILILCSPLVYRDACSMLEGETQKDFFIILYILTISNPFLKQ